MPFSCWPGVIVASLSLVVACVPHDVSKSGTEFHGSGPGIISDRCTVPRLVKSASLLDSLTLGSVPRNVCDPGPGEAEPAALRDGEIGQAWECLSDEINGRWQKSGHSLATDYPSWRAYGSRMFGGVAQGGCYMQIFVNDVGRRYGEYENSGKLPDGSRIAKTLFAANRKGRLMAGPLVAMERLTGAPDTKDTDGWRFTAIFPDGTFLDNSTEEGWAYVAGCASCHRRAVSGNYLFYPPVRVRELVR